MTTVPHDDPVAVALWLAIHTGDVATLETLLAEDPSRANVQVVGRGGGTRSPLAMVTDWPGYFPNGPAIVRLLLATGAEVAGSADWDGASETPLHWAASSDDHEVAAALIDGGADIEAGGGSIAAGTPLVNAVGYGCWEVARLLLSRGARVERLWVAAALGRREDVERLVEGASAEAIDEAFWHACRGGQRRTAEYLHGLGTSLTWVPDYGRGRAVEVARDIGTQHQNVVEWLELMEEVAKG